MEHSQVIEYIYVGAKVISGFIIIVLAGFAGILVKQQNDKKCKTKEVEFIDPIDVKISENNVIIRKEIDEAFLVQNEKTDYKFEAQSKQMAEGFESFGKKLTDLANVIEDRQERQYNRLVESLNKQGDNTHSAIRELQSQYIHHIDKG